MKQVIFVALCLLVAAPSFAAVVTKTVEYDHEGTVLKGYLAYDDAIAGKRPGVLVIHEWWGLNDYARMRTEQLARMGYLAFAADMYGGGAFTTDREEARRLSGGVRGTPLMRQRAVAGFRVLAAHELADTARLGAIGFCFGGTGVLELAYSGEKLNGVVSFHGGLFAPTPQEAAAVKARILVLHGAEDKPESITAFAEEMRKTDLDWQMVLYSGAVHAFTNPDAGNDKSRGAAYDAKAAARAWRHMQVFFDEIYAPAGK